MNKFVALVLILIALFETVDTAEKQILQEPIFQTFTDQTQIITLAQNQKFSLPITTRTISHRLQTFPQNSNECQFNSQSLLYKSLATATLLTGQQQQIGAILALKKKEKVFLADQNHNLLSYSLDQHFLLKKLAPKTNMVGGNKNSITTIVLTATDDEEYVYYMTPNKYYVFSTESLGSQIILQEQLQGNLTDIQKGITYKGYLFLLSRQLGPLVYKIDKATKRLTLLQKLANERSTFYTDMQFQKGSEILYLLSMNDPIIKVFHFQPSQFPNADKKFTIFADYDTINIESITNKHSGENDERNIHIDLTISTKREQQTLMILFLHNYHNVIAEVVYFPVQLKWKFVRYFKFSMRVNEIHIINDVVVVVGSQSMGIFPFGIHPRLIEEEFNGIMTLTSILRLKVLENGQFVGITKNTVQYGVIKLDERAEVTCKIDQGSKLKTVKLRANLTACSSQDRILYQNYCAYQKTFMIEEMQLTVTAPLADSLWTGMLIFLVLIILGICTLFAMQQKKERQIKRLQLYFQQKRRQPANPTDRRAANDL